MWNAIARCYIRIILLSSENRILQLQTSVERFYQYHEAYSSTSITLANRHESSRKDEGQRLRSTGACRDDNARHSVLSVVLFDDDDDDDDDDDRSEN